jgi:hypothetical protein
MLRTALQCETAITDCESQLIALRGHLADVVTRPDSPKRRNLMEIATIAVQVLDRELEFLRNQLGEARKREEK